MDLECVICWHTLLGEPGPARPPPAKRRRGRPSQVNPPAGSAAGPSSGRARPALLTHTEVVITKCGHMFHQPCLTDWFGVQKNCPTCRKALRINQIGPAFLPVTQDGVQCSKCMESVEEKDALKEEVEELKEEIGELKDSKEKLTRDLARMRQRYEEERATAKVVKRRLSTIQDMVRSSDEESGSSQYLSAAEEDV